MDFEEAIAAHSAWKRKLSAYLRSPDHSIQAAKVGMDNQCSLGQWLYGEGRKYASDPDFSQLQKAHANFHSEAADLVRRADGGEQVSEEAGLGANSQYAKVSSQVVQLIMKIKQKAK